MVELQRDDRASQSAPSSPRILQRFAFSSQSSRATTPGAQRSQTSAPTTLRTRDFHPHASLVLVGIRGSGKRSLGLIAATALGRRFVTEDHFFQTSTGLSRQDYLKVHGSEEFHRQDVDITRRMLEENKSNAVIDCGLGSLTSVLQDHLKQYGLTNPVVYLLRDYDQITTLLNLGDRSARLLQSADPSHRKCSNYEFYNLQEDSALPSVQDDNADRTSSTYSFKLRQAQADFSKFVRLITGNEVNRSASDSAFSIDLPVEHRAYTYALEIPFSRLSEHHHFAELQSACDLVEIIVDQWSNAAARKLSKLVATTRRYIQCPVLVSVRIPGSPPGSYLSILYQCLRLGLEYLSIDLQLSDAQLASFFALKGHTKIIGTLRYYTPTTLGWRDPALLDLAKKAALIGFDMIRIIQPSSSQDDVADLFWFRQQLAVAYSIRIPVIAYNSGDRGRTTQILNPILSPVSHRTLSGTVQGRSSVQASTLSLSEATQALSACFMLDNLNFYIIGGNVSASLSPCMHNAAYENLGLGHRYNTHNITSWEDVEQLARDEYFGGCSVVQPWKVKSVAKLTSLSQHAKAIGAVNTLIPLRVDDKGSLMPLQQQAYRRNRAGPVQAWYGENTDWNGIGRCVEQNLSPRNVISPKTSGLVIGAGGMARAAVYAMLQLGCRHIFVFNRTLANARSMARHFNHQVSPKNGIDSQRLFTSTSNVTPEEGQTAMLSSLSEPSSVNPVKVLESLSQPWPDGYNMPAMIVSCVTHEQLDGNPGADFKMPSQWLQSPSGGVVVEMAYMTKETALIRQMKQFRDRTGLPWVLVDGIETLIEQAIAQFQIMTGKAAPRKAMTGAIRAELRSNRQYVADGEEYIT